MTFWEDKRVLITGCSGFIGRNMVDSIREKGGNPSLVSHAKPTFDTQGADVFVGGMEDESFSVWLTDRTFDVIYHLGGQTNKPLFTKEPTRVTASIMGGVSAIARYAHTRDTHVIFPSAASIYGNSSVVHPEDDIPCPRDVYGMAKLASERILNAATANLTIMRISPSYGKYESLKGDHASVITLFAKSILAGKRPVIYGRGDQKRDFIYVQDVVDIMLEAAYEKKMGLYNVGTGLTYSLAEVAAKIAGAAEVKVQPVFLRNPNGTTSSELIDVSRLHSWWGKPAISIDDGIKLTVDYVRGEKK